VLLRATVYETEVQHLRLVQPRHILCPMTRRERADRNPRTMADYAQWFASRGGKARAKALTEKEKTTIGKKAARARWSKKKRSAK
jgi:hypothetical protein